MRRIHLQELLLSATTTPIIRIQSILQVQVRINFNFNIPSKENICYACGNCTITIQFNQIIINLIEIKYLDLCQYHYSD